MSIEDAVTQAISDREARAAEAQRKKEHEEQKKAEKALARARKKEEAAWKRTLAEKKKAEALVRLSSLSTGTSSSRPGTKRKGLHAYPTANDSGNSTSEDSRPQKRSHTTAFLTPILYPALSASQNPTPHTVMETQGTAPSMDSVQAPGGVPEGS
ncbi:hypothetical protein C8Q80DRAFT_1274763 [Daedaleopsis nitida]|nr:hypothetical protein C8Q80DRAFT_1274763 [Daedaleopsis nitida]